MGGKARRWVAKFGKWVAKSGYGRLRRELGVYVGGVSACHGNSLGSNPDISQNYIMGGISKGVANTL
jgi:hypothetical protein